jgi:LacI family transcriptional regulator
VSLATVSRGLRDDPGIGAATRKRLKALAAKMSYTPSRWGAALSSGRTRCILLVVPFDPSKIPQSNFLYTQVLEGAIEELAPLGYSVEVVIEKSMRSRKQTILEAIRDARVDGAIIVCMNVDDTLKKYKFPVPVVVVNQVFKSDTVDFVVAADRHGAFLATEHLIKAGHRRIAHVGGPLEYYGSRERRTGYTDALKAHGIPFREKLTRQIPRFTLEDGYSAAESLLNSKLGFTAVFSSGDILSAGIIFALRKHGIRVPDDISIASYDDEVLASTFSPPLTTVSKPRHRMGRAAAAALIDRLQMNPNRASRITEIETRLIERASVMPLKIF